MYVFHMGLLNNMHCLLTFILITLVKTDLLTADHSESREKNFQLRLKVGPPFIDPVALSCFTLQYFIMSEMLQCPVLC